MSANLTIRWRKSPDAVIMPETAVSWFFAYGSLMWKPGFEHEGMEHATLHGFARKLCIHSWYWRGTEDQPGLVMGLAPGDHCRGLAIRASKAREAEILAYLDERELVTDVYRRRLLPLTFADGRIRHGWCYVAKPDHPQFARDLTLHEMVEIIKRGHGVGGANTDYVTATVEHLTALGIEDPELEAIADALDNAGLKGGGVS